MTRFLIFRLYGPLAAWGDIAIGQKRGVSRIPSRSGILGLLGAALGLQRNDPHQDSLHSDYGIATRTEGDGTLLVDYHTAQTVDHAGVTKCPAHTRREEILVGYRNLNTILSSREYWSDLLYTVAVWPRRKALWSLDTLQTALRTPHFPLCLGRRSCPVGLPLSPTIIEGENPVEVLRDAEMTTAERDILKDLLLSATFEIAWEDFTVDIQQHTHTRRDQPGSRKVWQFSNRQEHRAVFQRGTNVHQ